MDIYIYMYDSPWCCSVSGTACTPFNLKDDGTTISKYDKNEIRSKSSSYETHPHLI